MHRLVCCIIIVGLCNLGIAAQGHDLWIESSREVVFVGEPINLDLKLGNCAVVTFLPFEEKLRTPDDERFRLITDDLGAATYLPTSSGPILISSHYIDASAKGDGYAATYFSATMYLHVRQRDAR